MFIHNVFYSSDYPFIHQIFYLFDIHCPFTLHDWEQKYQCYKLFFSFFHHLPDSFTSTFENQAQV